MQYLNLLPDSFSASRTTIMTLTVRNYTISYVPVKVYTRAGDSQVRQLRDGIGTMLLMIRMILLFNPMRFFVLPSAILCILGIVYGTVITLLVGQGFPVGGLLLITVGFLNFIFGLICNQISCLRMELFEGLDSIAPYRVPHKDN